MAARKKAPKEVPIQIELDGETWQITPALRKVLLAAKKVAPHATYRDLLQMYIYGET